MKTFAVLFGIIFLLALSFGTTNAQIPESITLQGQLFQQNGQPLPDGEYPVTVSLHAGPNTSDLIVICNPCTVQFSSGVFSLVLGGEGTNPLPPMHKQYWVQLSLNNEPLVPRLALHSVPYALATPGTVPVGSVMPYAGKASSVPEGWAVCNGAAMSSKSSPMLYQAIGTLWGNGNNDDDENTDFNLPDLRGLFLRGADDGSRDAYAHARIADAGPPVGSDDETVGTYHGTLQGFEERPLTKIDGIKQYGHSTSIADATDRQIALRTPNAAVLYIIRVR